MGAVPATLGLAVLIGFALPLAWGTFPAIAGIVAAGVLVEVRSMRWARWLARAGGFASVVASLSSTQRATLVALAGLAAAVFLAVGARAGAALCIAHPAALWAVPVVVLGGLAVSRTSGRLRVALALVFAALVPAAGIHGARFESAAVDARGWAQSGPVHGIHPFQITAVVVDGYGPFDLPINDYVEPDGSRGYGPVALAEALERALHRIAEVHFSDGPARAREAFAGAEVEAMVTPPVYERLDREPAELEHPRFVVRSGTTGQRSSVEFVCPGRRDDPRGISGESLMNRMCPDKYASEGSAGLGVTGRWPGYAEGRGNERLGLSTWLGRTRSDDEAGRAWLADELRWTAFIVLGIVLVVIALPSGVLAGGVREVGGGACALAIVALCLAWIVGDASPRVDAWTRGVSTLVDARWVSWLPLFVLVADLHGLGARISPPPAGSVGSPRWGRLVPIPLLVATLLVAGGLSASTWVTPHVGIGEGLPLARWVEGLADTLAGTWGLSIGEIEGAIAATGVAILLAMAVALSSTVGALTHAAWPEIGGRKLARLAPLAGLVLVAAALVVSRKTEGAATLVPGAIGLCLVLQSGLACLARVRLGGARATAVLVHVAWTALGMALVVESFRMAEAPHPFVLLTTAAGLSAALAGLSLAVSTRRRGGSPPGSNAGESSA